MTKQELLDLLPLKVKSGGVPSKTTGEDLRVYEVEVINTIFDLALTKVSILDIVNSLNSTAIDKPLAAAAGKALNDQLIAINLILQSNNINLDSFQEIVDAISAFNANAHIQGTDTMLASGTANQVTASEIREFLNNYVQTVAIYNPLEVVHAGWVRSHNSAFWEYIYNTPEAGHTPAEGTYWKEISKAQATAAFAQTTGQSTLIGMSQKAITDLLFLSSGAQTGNTIDLAIKYQTRTITGTALIITGFTNAAVGRRVRLEILSQNRNITGALSNNGNGTVTGVGTSFLTEISPGQVVEVNGLRRSVTSVTSNTQFNTGVWGTGNGFSSASGKVIDTLGFNIPGATLQFTGLAFLDAGTNIVEIECVALNKYEIFISPV